MTDVRETVLSCHMTEDLEPVTLTVDWDYESGRVPDTIVWLMFYDDDEPWYRLTVSEAEDLHRKLGIILGKD